VPWLIPQEPGSSPTQHPEPREPHVVQAPLLHPQKDAGAHRETPCPCMQHPPLVQTLVWQQRSRSCPQWVVHVYAYVLLESGR
jgi:hypothetical protein